MTSAKLKYIPYGQAHIETEDNGEMRLVSYVTTVVTVSADGWVKVLGLYSQMTRKHIGAFFREKFGLEYRTAKLLNYYGDEYNYLTGEIRHIEGD